MLNYVALGLLIFVFLFIFYAIIVIHDIPYEMAKKRNHPHLDAIHVGGWVSMFTLHAIWPFLWIWASLYHPERGWGMVSNKLNTKGDPLAELQRLRQQINALEQVIHKKKPSYPTATTDSTTQIEPTEVVKEDS